MMYFFKKLDDGAEVNYSEASDEGNVKMYIEKPDKEDGFHHMTVYLPHFDVEEEYGFSEEEFVRYIRFLWENGKNIVNRAREKNPLADDIVRLANTELPIVVLKAQPLSDRRMIVIFSTGEKRFFDAKKLTGPAFEPLKDEKIFSDIFLRDGVITWENENIDVAPEYVYSNSYDINMPTEDFKSEKEKVAVVKLTHYIHNTYQLNPTSSETRVFSSIDKAEKWLHDKGFEIKEYNYANRKYDSWGHKNDESWSCYDVSIGIYAVDSDELFAYREPGISPWDKRTRVEAGMEILPELVQDGTITPEKAAYILDIDVEIFEILMKDYMKHKGEKKE